MLYIIKKLVYFSLLHIVLKKIPKKHSVGCFRIQYVLTAYIFFCVCDHFLYYYWKTLSTFLQQNDMNRWRSNLTNIKYWMDKITQIKHKILGVSFFIVNNSKNNYKKQQMFGVWKWIYPKVKFLEFISILYNKLQVNCIKAF